MNKIILAILALASASAVAATTNPAPQDYHCGVEAARLQCSIQSSNFDGTNWQQGPSFSVNFGDPSQVVPNYYGCNIVQKVGDYVFYLGKLTDTRDLNDHVNTVSVEICSGNCATVLNGHNDPTTTKSMATSVEINGADNQSNFSLIGSLDNKSLLTVTCLAFK